MTLPQRKVRYYEAISRLRLEDGEIIAATDFIPCVTVCPTGASHQRDDGIVLVDQDTCIGCRACMMACPYSNRFYLRTL